MLLRCTAIIGAVAIAAGCYQRDFKLVLRNDTPDTFLVRVKPGRDFGEHYSVARIGPGAEGQVAAWSGPRDTAVELLSPGCSLIGVFDEATDGTVSVPALSGLSGTISAWAGFEDWRNQPDSAITFTEQCDGFMPR
jgi:hypothetical protein